MPLTVVFGGPRSGKNELAQQLAAGAGLPVRHIHARPPAAVRGANGLGDPDGRPAKNELVAALEEASDSAVVIDDWAAFLVEGIAATADRGAPDGSEMPWDEGAGFVDAAIDALARRDQVSVVVADDIAGTTQHDGGDNLSLDQFARATQRLTNSADQLLLAVAGRLVEVPPLPKAKPVGHDELRHQTDVTVAHGAEDFANIVVDEGPPEWLQAILRDALETDVRRYPDEREAVLTIAARYGRDPSEVVLTNGAVDACWLLAAALEPRHAVCVGPTFAEPEVALSAFGHPVHRVISQRETGFLLDPAIVPPSADFVFLGNPNNPTGSLSPADSIRSLAHPGRVVVVDEAFMEFVPGERDSVAGESIPSVVVLRSVTKLLSIPGLRVGYLLASPELAAQLRNRRAKWAVNSLALAALTAWNKRPQAGEDIARRVGRWRREFVRQIKEIPGVEVYPSTANFVLINVPDGPTVLSHLAELGFAVRPAGSYPGLTSNDVRITIRSQTTNSRLAAALNVAVEAPAE